MEFSMSYVVDFAVKTNQMKNMEENKTLFFNG